MIAKLFGIIGTRAPAWCLYRGALAPVLELAAPHLLRIGRGHAYTEQLFQMGWRSAWGFLFASAADPKVLRRHLRRFLRVRTEAGRILAFRYYDPRVLRVYLPTCTPEEVRALFGPIDAIVVEARAPGAFHLFRAGPEGLQQSLVPCPGETPPPMMATAQERT